MREIEGWMIRLQSKLKHPVHVALASADWLRQLEWIVSERIGALGGFETLEGEGEVSSRYGEDRFMGPNSLCKYDFDVVVRVNRLTSLDERDEYRAVATYDPGPHTFETKSEDRVIRRLQVAAAQPSD